MKISRHSLLSGVAAMVLIALAAGITYVLKQRELETTQEQVATLQEDIDSFEDQVRQLSYNTATGGGVNLKLMLDPENHEPTVPLYEVFSFDRNYALCRVETNEQAFMMPTHEMGEVLIEPNQFFMSMEVTSIDQFELTTESDGTHRVTMRGGLDCATEVGQTNTTIGSRESAEHATYRIEAVDKGIGGGQAGDTFAFTVFFDPEEAPINYAIFGPEFTFTGEMIAGEITILDPDHP